MSQIKDLLTSFALQNLVAILINRFQISMEG